MTNRAVGKAYRARLAAAGLQPLCGKTWEEVEVELDARAGQADSTHEGSEWAHLARPRTRPATTRRKAGKRNG